jgi:hypothetical protein
MSNYIEDGESSTIDSVEDDYAQEEPPGVLGREQICVASSWMVEEKLQRVPSIFPILIVRHDFSHGVND